MIADTWGPSGSLTNHRKAELHSTSYSPFHGSRRRRQAQSVDPPNMRGDPPRTPKTRNPRTLRVANVLPRFLGHPLLRGRSGPDDVCFRDRSVATHGNDLVPRRSIEWPSPDTPLQRDIPECNAVGAGSRPGDGRRSRQPALSAAAVSADLRSDVRRAGLTHEP